VLVIRDYIDVSSYTSQGTSLKQQTIPIIIIRYTNMKTLLFYRMFNYNTMGFWEWWLLIDSYIVIFFSNDFSILC